ncbi:S-layer homology domain-containing protein [Paenibacillus xylaniclasticus]|uniref:S-layer homology domain-containing protein n=1 Tax=Paenibacillus xylaniclasticus TaxID=588083 RepID=UPI000FD8A8F3|nr:MULTISPECIES: S-layer homology domain-containing protein [Paenibacillus]GFN32776.1 hypothetical protein PCURB6_30360 [Paenibacillus curdlanolyticus]
MSVKGRLFKYSLAAAIVTTGFAGIPFSEKGLVKHLAAQSAYAADAAYSQQAIDRYSKVYNALDTQGKAKVESARQAIVGLDHNQRVVIAGPIANKFNVSDADRGVLADLVVSLLSVPAVLDVNALEDIRTNTTYRSALKSAAASAGVTDTSAVTVEAVAKAAVAAEASVAEQLKSKTLIELVSLAKNVSERNALISHAVNNALSTSDVAELRQLFQGAGVTGEDFVQAVSQLRTAIGGSVFDEASNAIALAYLSTLGTDEQKDTNNNVVVVPVQTVDKQIDALITKLANASDAEKQQIVQQALDLFTQLLKSSNSVSVQPTVVDGIAVVDASKELAAKLDLVVAAAAKLQTLLKTAQSDAAIPTDSLTINLSEIAVDTVNLKLSEEVMKKLNSSPYIQLNLALNGVTIGFPNSSEFGKSIDLNVRVSEYTGNQKAVSSVYSFDLRLGGQAATHFSNPVALQFPINDTFGVDTEKLTLAKVHDDGKIDYHGGVLKDGNFREKRTSFSSYVVVENNVTFSDIGSVKAWAGRQIEVLAAKGAISGRAADKFVPKDNVTRAEFAKMLIHALDLDSYGLTTSFKDIKSSDWFAPYVAAAANKGIITGRSADTFAPNATITRAEMATMIARALRLTSGEAEVKDVDGELSKFKDASAIHASLKEGVALAASKGIIIGNAGKFNPNNNATRAEAAVILYRALQMN